MPICPKCGKSFSSEQALSYHLNKKYKCGTWKCSKCDIVFDTKFNLKIHSMNCDNNYSNNIVPSYDKLCTIYTNSPFTILEYDEANVIQSVSPSCVKNYGFNPVELIGKHNNEFLEKIGDVTYRRRKNGELVQVQVGRISNTLMIESILESV